MSYSLAFSQAIALVTLVAFKGEYGIYNYVPTQVLAESLNMAAPTAVKLLQSLSRAGIVETREGLKGGIRLAKRPAAITLLDILRAIEQDRPLFRLDLKMRIPPEHSAQAQKSITAALDRAEEAMKAELYAVTIADVIA